MEKEMEIKKKRKSKLWIIIPVLVICVVFISLVNAGILDDLFGKEKKSNVLFTKITPTSKKVCNDKTCTLTLYSGTRYVNEDYTWKEIEKAKDLSGTGIQCDIKYDGLNYAKCLSYNLTSMTLELSRKTSGDSPIKVYEYNETKSRDTGKKEYDLKLEEPYSFENNYVNKSLPDCEEFGVPMEFESADCNREGENKTEMKYEEEQIVLTLNAKYGDKIHFGDKSTTIVLQDADSENLADSFIESNSADTNHGADVDITINNNTAEKRHGIIRFNITAIPSSMVIEDAKLKLYIVGNGLDADTEGYNISINHIYTSYGWNESGVTWNNKPTPTTDYNTTRLDTFKFFGGAGEPISQWRNYTVTDAVNSDYGNGYKNISFYILPHDLFGAPLGTDDVRFVSKEELTNVDKRPILEITYDVASYNFTYLFNGTDTTVYSNADGTANGVAFDDVNLFYELIQGNTSGNFTSSVFDLTGNNTFGNISWVQGAPYQQELPDSQEDELQTTKGGANMTGNVLLMHMNDNAPWEFPDSQLDDSAGDSGINMTGNVLLMHFNNDANDNSGEANNGVASGTVYNTTAKLGSHSLTTNGTGGYVQIADDSSLQFETGNFSISAWFKVPNAIGVNRLMGKRRTTGAVDQFNIQFSGNKVGLLTYDGTTSEVYGTTQLNDTKWHHVIATRQDNGNITIYVDGVLENSATTVARNVSAVGDWLGIGGSTQLTNWFSGTMDEVAIWNRSLSAGEVLNIYNQQAPLVQDTSGNENNGTGQGQVNCSASGKLGDYGCSFDGEGDYIDAGNDISLNISEEITVSAWIKPNEVTSEQKIVNKKLSNTHGYELTIDGGNVYHYISNGTSTAGASKAVSVNQWQHIVGTYDGTNLNVYVNGVVGTSATQNKLATADAYSLKIGARETGADLFFNGTIDEVAIWNRSLSADEVSYLYLRGALELNLSVRSCDDASCSGESWNGTYINSSYVDISDLTPNRYFQYKFDFVTNDTDFSPQLYNVTMNYVGVALPDSCTYAGYGTWTVSCSDNCVIATQYVVDGNLSLNGAGDFTLKANLTFNDSSNEQFIFNNGCSFINDAFVVKNT